MALADEVGVSRLEIRRRNLIAREAGRRIVRAEVFASEIEARRTPAIS